jgi:anti-sigma regulatory factor (Ser/Thr protein kinase)
MWSGAAAKGGETAPVSGPAWPPGAPWVPSARCHGGEVKCHRGDFWVSRATPFMARSLCRLLLAEWGIPAEPAGVAELLVTELATNAVRFGTARRPVPYVTLALWAIPGAVIAEVSDEGGKPPEARVADPDAEGGRGLMLVEALSREWSWYVPRPGWKTVYCVITTGQTFRNDIERGPQRVSARRENPGGH